MANSDEKASDSEVVERPEPLEKSEAEQRLQTLLEEYRATWNGIDDPQDPYNWPFIRKLSVALIISLGQLVSLMSTSIMAPALNQIAHDLRLSSSEVQIALSISLLGLAFGPFFVAALAEIYGRKPIWIAFNLSYMLWNSLCPVGYSAAIMYIGRFLGGFSSSVSIALNWPIMADMYPAKDRGKSLALATLVPYTAPALGPLIGGLLSQHVSWPWLFWALSIISAVVTMLGALIFKETYTPVLLHRKAVKLQTVPPDSLSKSWIKTMQNIGLGIMRPIKLLIQQPLIQILALILALEFGVYLLVLSTFANLWIDRYHQSQTQSALNYIAIALGSIVAGQCGGFVLDYVYKVFTRRNGGVARPEFRIPYMISGVMVAGASLFWYGWCAERRTIWIATDLGIFFYNTASTAIAQAGYAYLLDEFKHTASANAAARFLSNIFAFAFPIFGPKMYQTLGYGWANSLLGLLTTGLGLPIAAFLWFRGQAMRASRKKDA